MSATPAAATAAPLSLRDRLRLAHVRPVVLGPSLSDVFGDPNDDRHQALAMALRRSADAIVALQRAIADAGAEVVLAPTAATTAPALHATGQAYRAAALTAAAVDLSRDGVLAGGSSASVLGEVPTRAGSRARMEAQLHVDRLATSTIDGILVLGDDLAVAAEIGRVASSHGITTLLEIEAGAARDLVSHVTAAPLVGFGGVVLRGHPDVLPFAVETLRSNAARNDVPVGVRVQTGGDAAAAQMAVARAWELVAHLGVAMIGVSGGAALAGLAAVVELTRVSRASLPGSPA